jgi:hypothetical protein
VNFQELPFTRSKGPSELRLSDWLTERHSSFSFPNIALELTGLEYTSIFLKNGKFKKHRPPFAGKELRF